MNVPAGILRAVGIRTQGKRYAQPRAFLKECLGRVEVVRRLVPSVSIKFYTQPGVGYSGQSREREVYGILRRNKVKNFYEI